MPPASTALDSGRDLRPESVRIWDPFVRIFHWGVVAAFLVAYAAAEEWDAAHEAAGYTIAALVGLRVVWGFIGSQHARFADFIYRPGTVAAFLNDTMRLRAKRYLGHNPAGGVMVIALLFMLAIITGSGILMTTDAYHAVHWIEELHEIAVNLTLILIAVHVAGVILASFEHGENLVKAMFTGRKRP